MKTVCFKIFLLLTAMIVASPSRAQQLVEAVPDKNNQKVIKRYNSFHFNFRAAITDPSAMNVGYTAIFGVKENSIMSTKDVEVNVVKRWVQDAVIDDLDNRMYFIEIKNKTSQPLYIDKSRCFRIYHDGSKYCYFDAERDDSSKTPRILVIPPHAKKNLCDYKAVVIDKGKYPEVKIIDYPEDFHWNAKEAGVGEGSLAQFDVITFTEDNSPYLRSFELAYSNEKDFSAYSLLTINCYIRELIGCFYPEMYQYENVFDRMGAGQYTITNCEYGYGGVNPNRRTGE